MRLPPNRAPQAMCTNPTSAAAMAPERSASGGLKGHVRRLPEQDTRSIERVRAPLGDRDFLRRPWAASARASNADPTSQRGANVIAVWGGPTRVALSSMHVSVRVCHIAWNLGQVSTGRVKSRAADTCESEATM